MQSKRSEAMPRRNRREERAGPWPLPVCLLLVLAACCTACTEGDGGPHGLPGPSAHASWTSAPAPSGPPMHFDSDNGVPLPAEAAGGRITVNGRAISPLPLLLHDGIVYLASAHDLRLLRTDTAPVFRTVPGSDEESGDTDGGRWVAPPVLTTVGTKDLVLAPFPARSPGGERRVRIVAVDTGTRAAAWTRTITPEGVAASARNMRVRAAGAAESTLVLTVSGDGVSDTYAVDLPGGRVRWRLPGFEASTVSGSTVVGLAGSRSTQTAASAGNDEQRVRGVGLSSGKYLWTAAHGGYGLAVQGAGRTYVVVTRPTGVATGVFALLRASDGSQVRSWKGKDFGQTCHYDDEGITVCAGTDPQAAVAIDSVTGTILWQMPDPSGDEDTSGTSGTSGGTISEVPRVTTAWHGVVYGLMGDKAVALSARDGRVLSQDAGIAPILVDRTAGIAFDLGDSRVKAFAVAR